MNRISRETLFVLALTLGCVSASHAELTGDEAAAIVQQRLGGARVLSVTRARSAPEWRVKVLSSQGEVRTINIDAVDGRTEAPLSAPSLGRCADGNACRPQSLNAAPFQHPLTESGAQFIQHSGVPR